MNFHNFLQVFNCTDEIPSGKPMQLSSLSDSDVRLVIDNLGGKTFNDGLYRVVHADDIQPITEIVKEAFPEFDDRLVPFGFDWLGRVFAVDKSRIVNGHKQVTMVEFGAGEAMQIPCSAIEFHESELINFADDALSRPFYDQWRLTYTDSLTYEKCVGYRVPLFLNGSDTVDNLEVSDRAVYWEFCRQLRSQVKSMRDGQGA
jgi:hypothetical protein